MVKRASTGPPRPPARAWPHKSNWVGARAAMPAHLPVRRAPAWFSTGSTQPRSTPIHTARRDTCRNHVSYNRLTRQLGRRLVERSHERRRIHSMGRGLDRHGGSAPTILRQTRSCGWRSNIVSELDCGRVCWGRTMAVSRGHLFPTRRRRHGIAHHVV